MIKPRSFQLITFRAPFSILMIALAPLADFFFKKLDFMCMSVFACAYVCSPRACPVSRRSGEGVACPGTGVAHGFEPQCGCWQPNPDPLAGAAGALRLWAISPALQITLVFVCLALIAPSSSCPRMEAPVGDGVAHLLCCDIPSSGLAPSHTAIENPVKIQR